MNVKEIILVTKVLPAQTPWDHMSVSVSLYILKMDKAAQVVVRFPLKSEKSYLSWWEKSYFSVGAVAIGRKSDP